MKIMTLAVKEGRREHRRVEQNVIKKNNTIKLIQDTLFPKKII